MKLGTVDVDASIVSYREKAARGNTVTKILIVLVEKWRTAACKQNYSPGPWLKRAHKKAGPANVGPGPGWPQLGGG